MAVYDRCILCDYSEAGGSTYMNVPPRQNGKVRQHSVRGHLPVFYCESCWPTQTLEFSVPADGSEIPTLDPLDELDDDLSIDAPALPVREEF